MWLGIRLSCQSPLARSAANRTSPRLGATASARSTLSAEPLAILFALSLAACSSSSTSESFNENNPEMPSEDSMDGVNGSVSGELLIRTFGIPGALTQPFSIDLTSGKARAAIPASVTNAVNASTGLLTAVAGRRILLESVGDSVNWSNVRGYRRDGEQLFEAVQLPESNQREPLLSPSGQLLLSNIGGVEAVIQDTSGTLISELSFTDAGVIRWVDDERVVRSTANTLSLHSVSDGLVLASVAVPELDVFSLRGDLSVSNNGDRALAVFRSPDAAAGSVIWHWDLQSEQLSRFAQGSERVVQFESLAWINEDEYVMVRAGVASEFDGGVADIREPVTARLVAMPTNVSTPHSINEVGSDSEGVRTLLRQSQIPSTSDLDIAESPGELTPDELSDRFDYFSIVWQPAQ